jgi:hypothetical protein
MHRSRGLLSAVRVDSEFRPRSRPRPRPLAAHRLPSTRRPKRSAGLAQRGFTAAILWVLAGNERAERTPRPPGAARFPAPKLLDRRRGRVGAPSLPSALPGHCADCREPLDGPLFQGHERRRRVAPRPTEGVPGSAILGPQPVEVSVGEQPTVSPLPRTHMNPCHLDRIGGLRRSQDQHCSSFAPRRARQASVTPARRRPLLR